MKRVMTTALATLLGILGAEAQARPPHRRALADYFGPKLARKLNDCRICHVPAGPDDDPDDKPHNPFGARLKAIRAELKAAGKPSGIPARLEAVADEDSDGDGVANLLEILAGRYPGEPDDTPTLDEQARARRDLAAFRASKTPDTWSPLDPVRRPALPRVRAEGWARNPIDLFIAAEHEARGLRHRPEAPGHVLLRRVYLDLTGLPPTAEELHAFLDDKAPDAYERLVDRLLASPRYGERWGRHWMDVWRYSDWAGWGEQVRDSQPHIWHWRDWIIESLNRDKGYDRMVVEMLAADEAAPDDPDALRATGYLARNFKLLSREKWMQDVVDHTGQAFLGLTFGCARCHDHMYDPILQSEYYRVRAIFEPHNVRIDRLPGQVDLAKGGLPRAFDANPGVKTFLFVRGDDRNPAKEPLPPGVPESLGVTLGAIEPVALPRDAYDPDHRAFVAADDLAASRAAIVRARQARAIAARLAANLLLGLVLEPSRLPTARVATRRDALVLASLDLAIAEGRHEALAATIEAEAIEDAGRKGNDSWDEAARRASGAQRNLARLEARRSLFEARRARRSVPAAGRAEAAKKVAAAAKALAGAEAAAERPATTSYRHRPSTTYPATSTGRRLAFARWIGRRENPLTARVAVNHMWLRHFGQAIVPTVADFGRNGRAASHPALLDWLAAEFVDRGWSMKAMHRLIVTSATYRQDSTPDPADLAIDPDDVYVWRMAPRRLEAEAVRDAIFAVAGALDLTMGGPDIDHRRGLDVPRRSVYFRHAAEKQMELLRIFDGPAVTECYRRHESTMPQQALALANSELTIRNARSLARGLAEEVGPSPAAFTVAAFERVLSRPPTDDELAECLAFLGRRRSSSADPGLRAREGLVHVLLNHHEFVTIR
ncbi:MAG TPA: DUF1549 and DUF1553 domain-containing protein [Isosphaeraceae bacterium]|jgi:hypothetical protein|nr:DUF1549 and DUF1553 domain-containing protein [Isosphaeraceae bacterium]